MTKLFVIAGHGAGDPGAVGNGYREADMVRKLAQRIKDFGGSSVMLGDFSRNYYADNGISNLGISKDYAIIELHMDAASAGARGGHVIIKAGIGGADAFDNALASVMKKYFPGRANLIVERNDLANPSRAAARGYNYRLVECGFITNSGDCATFLNKMDEIAKSILACFNIGSGEAPAPSTTTSVDSKPSVDGSIDELAQRVINGKFGNGADRQRALGSKYEAVQKRVNEILGVGTGSGSSKPAKKENTVDLEALADAVIRGDYGNGDARKKALGSNYDAVQAIVNRRLGAGGGSAKSSVNIDDLARRTIKGEFGNGEARKKALGANYAAVQKRVNEMLS